MRSSYLSPGRQNLQVILNTANIPTGTNLSGLIFLSAADGRRELEVTTKIISPLPVTPVLAAPTKVLPAQVLNSQDWGYRFSGSAADKFVRAQLGKVTLKKSEIEALMSEILDQNSHLQHFSD
ncbi:MAG: hypothetical protein MGG11_03640 [Trichodesmium sp. MAG_R03]|nr:hypothetical protein [Trichodesmium sp. MAG_R03]